MNQPTIQQIREAYDKADDKGKELLTSLYGKETVGAPITKRIKTFVDALEALGHEHPLVVEFLEMTKTTCQLSDDIVAYLKLRIIVATLNEGWKPQFTENEWRYFPYFHLYTQEEYDNFFNEKQKADCVLFGGSAHNGAYCGFAFAYSSYAPSRATSYFGSRLCFKTSELAVYAGRQFTNIYFDYLMR
jgi:hypothetical protein